MTETAPRECHWTASRMAAAIRAGEITSEELVGKHLEWIERRNPELNAIVTLDAEGALEAARDADKALATEAPESIGALHGVPVTIKDTFDVANMRTTSGFRRNRHRIALTDSTVAHRLRKAGAVILGKTNVPENAFDWQCNSPIFGRTSNPVDPERTPGGSSGGSCAAVGAELVPLDIGSDLAGSIRVPAHYCGVYGLKATEHRISDLGHGVFEGAVHGVRHILSFGPFARDVEDLALALRVLEGPDGICTEVPPITEPEPDPFDLDGAKIAVTGDLGVPIDSDTRQAIRSLRAAIEAAGAVVDDSPPRGYEIGEAIEAWGHIAGAEMGASVPPAWRIAGRVLIPLFIGRNTWSRGFTRGMKGGMRRTAKALEVRDRYVRKIDARLRSAEVWILPAASTPAFAHRRAGRPIEVDGKPLPYAFAAGAYATALALTGHPIAVIPVGKSGGGLPIGVQIVGRRFGDRALLAAAAAIDTALRGGL